MNSALEEYVFFSTSTRLTKNLEYITQIRNLFFLTWRAQDWTTLETIMEMSIEGFRALREG